MPVQYIMFYVNKNEWEEWEKIPEEEREPIKKKLKSLFSGELIKRKKK